MCYFAKFPQNQPNFLDISQFLAHSANLPEGIYILPMFCYLFSPLGKPADRAIYFTFHNFFFFLLRAKLSQYLLDRFSRSLHQMEGICVNFPNLVQFLRFLNGRCHGNQFCFVTDSFARSQSISGTAGPIFTNFAPYCRY